MPCDSVPPVSESVVSAGSSAGDFDAYFLRAALGQRLLMETVIRIITS